jgi:hypothetical protein
MQTALQMSKQQRHSFLASVAAGRSVDFSSTLSRAISKQGKQSLACVPLGLVQHVGCVVKQKGDMPSDVMLAPQPVTRFDV